MKGVETIDTNTDSSSTETLLSPRSLNAYRLRQATASLLVSLVAGLACWFLWVGLRQYPQAAVKLVAIMSLTLGCVFLIVALVSLFGVLFQSIYCIYRFQFGRRNLALALMLIPLFALPFLFN